MDNTHKIRVAIDSNVFFYLLNFDNALKQDRLITTMIEQGQLSADRFKNVSKFKQPIILKGALGKVVRGRYVNLSAISRLFEHIKNGDIEACITPKVLEEVYTPQNYQFISKYIKVLKVRAEDRQNFFRRRDELVNLYAKHGAIRKVYDRKKDKVHYSNDGIIMAEASLFGLNLLTYDHHLYHRDKAGDYIVAKLIRRCNGEFGLLFKSNNCELTTPRSLTPNKFLHIIESKVNETAYFENSLIDEYNKYTDYNQNLL